MKKLLSFICMTSVILSVSACAESQNAPATGTVNMDTTTSAAAAPETTTEATTTIAGTVVPFETTTAADFTSDEIICQTTEGYVEPTNPLTTSSTTKSAVISDETGMYVPGYDPGMPEAWFNFETTEIYSDTEQIVFSLNTEGEFGTGIDFIFQKKTDNGWETLERVNGSVILDSWAIVTKDSPLVMELRPADYGITFEAGCDYRLAKNINGKEYETFFVVGQRNTPLKREDIELYLADTDWLTENNLHNLTIKYTYVGNADYAEYCFGCEYTLEKRDDKGEWVTVPFSENAGFIELGYIIGTDSPNQTTTVYLNNDFYAEPLTAGTYRIVKPVEDINYTLLFRINDKYNYEPEPSDSDIKMTIKEVTENIEITPNTEKITVNIDYVGNDDFAVFGYGAYTAVEKYYNGEWNEVKYKDGYAWDDLLYLVGHENRNSSIDVWLSTLAEPLTGGKYRVKKTISGTKNFYAEFAVAETTAFKTTIINEDEIKTNTSSVNIEIEYVGDETDFMYEFNMASYSLYKNVDDKWKQLSFRDDIAFCDGIDLIMPEQKSFTKGIALAGTYTEEITEGEYKAVIYSYQGVAIEVVFYVQSEYGHEKFKYLTVTTPSSQIKESTEYKSLFLNYEYTGEDDKIWIYPDYQLQKMGEDGKWQVVEFSSKIDFEADPIILSSENPKANETISLNDKYFKKPLTTGKYRVVKMLCDCTDRYIEFEIAGIGDPLGAGSITLTINEITENSFVCYLPWPYPAVYTVEITDTDLLDEYCIGDNIEVDYGNMYQQSEWDYLIVDAKISQSSFQLNEEMDYKPVIYLYPKEKTEVNVKLDYNGELTVTYPEYRNGWNVTAMPDGTLYDENGNEYSYLFWEGKSDVRYDFSNGFCVRGEDTVEFLRWALSALGLSPREYNEFIVFWLPFMQDNEYNIISFQYDCYTDNAVLSVTPEPDTVLRVFMAFYASDVYVDIPAQELTTTKREGFTVVEWGGAAQAAPRSYAVH